MEQSLTPSSATRPTALTLAGGEALLSPTNSASNVAQVLLSPTSIGANAAGATLLSPTSTAPVMHSPKSSKLRQRHRKKAKGRVTWDEQAIAEHDKERGTRQKIDEPDTPYVRSPQTASDSEAGPASSDDEHRHFRPPMRLAMKGVNWKPEPEPDGGSACPAEREVNATAVADRLDAWVRSGGDRKNGPLSSLFSNASSDAGDCVADTSRMSSTCSSRSSSTAPQRRQTAEGVFDTSKGSHNKDRRISMEEEAAPRPSSDKFVAKRVQHYNEVAAMKAFKQQKWKEEESTDTSDEEKQDDVITTNTNTNINTTISQAEAIPLQRRPSLGGGESAASSDREGRARLPSIGGGESAASSDREGRTRSNVSFSGGESGNESSEDFRNQRRRHYSEEVRRRDPTVAATVSSLQTNTNTNVNAAMAAASGSPTAAADKPNPMEEGRPPVQFEGGDEGALSTASSEEFRALRQQHYGREFEAVQRFRAESGGEEESSGTSEEAGDEADAIEPPQEAALQATEEQAHVETTMVLPSGRGDEAEPIVTASNPANPMEPREAGVAFTVESGSTSAAAFTDGQGGPSSDSRSAADEAREASWKAKRNAHYSEMAAALRLSAPPPSDDEEEEEEEEDS